MFSQKSSTEGPKNTPVMKIFCSLRHCVGEGRASAPVQRPADGVPQRHYGHLQRAEEGGRRNLHLRGQKRRGLLGPLRSRRHCHG